MIRASDCKTCNDHRWLLLGGSATYEERPDREPCPDCNPDGIDIEEAEQIKGAEELEVEDQPS